MAFSRSNPLGWALYEVLTSAQMNALDIDHANAIDGADGGTYDPSTAVTFAADKFEASPAGGQFVLQDGYVDYSSHTAIRAMSWQGAFFDYDWGYDSADGFPEQTDVTPGNNVSTIVVPTPMQGTLTGVSVWVKGATGHAGLPATMPALAVRWTESTSWSSLGSQTDPSASVGAYQAYHEIALTGLTQAVNAGNLLRIQIVGESSTNSLAGLKAYLIVTRTTCTKGFPQ